MTGWLLFQQDKPAWAGLNPVLSSLLLFAPLVVQGVGNWNEVLAQTPSYRTETSLTAERVFPMNEPSRVPETTHPSPASTLSPRVAPPEKFQQSKVPPFRTAEPPFPGPPFLTFGESKVQATWLPGSGNRIGFFDLDINQTLAFPQHPGFTIKPIFGAHFLDGPRRTDLPPRLYDLQLEFRQRGKLNRQWGFDLAVTPGLFSDFEQGNSDALRIQGRAVAVYGFSPATKALFGVAYLDREDVPILPVLGVIHTPTEDIRWELVFPKPKLAVRCLHRPDLERWLYLAGEFGGGSWAIERTTGQEDVATYSDWRLIAGIENQYTSGWKTLIEFGYVFNRELEYSSGPGDFDPSDTAMFRLGVTY